MKYIPAKIEIKNRIKPENKYRNDKIKNLKIVLRQLWACTFFKLKRK